MRKHIIIIFAFFALQSHSNAQSLVQQEEYEMNELLHTWTQTQNAAGLGLSTIKTGGVTELGYSNSGGDYHRAQEGDGKNGIDFKSERYDQLGKNFVSWGSFNFVMDRESNRKWSDVLNTYNNNPYIYGSSVAGDYDLQMFDFHAKVATRLAGNFNFGLGIDYTAADLSRLRDPRTRVFYADYAAIPGVTYRLNKKQVLGLNLSVRYQKEKMPNITTVQDDPNLKYYTFYGMENADGVIAGYKGFQRQFVSDFYGFDLQYAFTNEKINFLLNGGIFTQNQDILEGLMQSPGTFNSIHFKGNAVLNVYLDGFLLNTSLAANVKKSAADENLQELITVRNESTGVSSQEWVTLYTYENRYLNNTYDVNFDLNIRDINTIKNDYKWTAGIEAAVVGFENRYYLPFSEMIINRANAGLYGHYRVFNKRNHRVTFDVGLNYEFAFGNTLQLNETSLEVPAQGASTFVEGTFDVASNVIQPDFVYYNASALRYNMESKYSFPLLFKNVKLIGFAKVFFNQTRSEGAGNWTGAGISIGIIP